MRITVLDADTIGRDLDYSPLEEFGEVTVFGASSPEEIAPHLGDSEVAVINKLKMNEQTIGSVADTLRLICVFATGYDNIDLDFCRQHNIAVCNVVGYSTASVAQLTVATVLSLLCHLPEYTSHVSSGAYSASGCANILEPVYHELTGKTWGIVGYGNIGKAVGKVASAFGCRVLAYKRTPEAGVNTVGIDTLCRECDIISVHLPLCDGTRGLISRERIAQMKPEAIFVNMARGAIADEAALAEAVAHGRLGGLGGDVYSVEPFPAEHPFYAVRNNANVCFTPHMAWGAKEARERCLFEICENIRSFADGGKRSRVD